MFILSEMKDVVRIPPDQFHQSLTESVTTILNRKLANKVVLNVGLCIALFDIVHIGHSYIYPGDGSSHTEVSFRYIVFRPLIDEIMIGKIRGSTRDGLQVTLGFFEDIQIPIAGLPYPVRFEESDQSWVWEYDTSPDNRHDLYMDNGDKLRFRVTREIFEESPLGPPSAERVVQGATPYRIFGSISEPGLGMLSWWEKNEPGDEDGVDESANDKQ